MNIDKAVKIVIVGAKGMLGQELARVFASGTLFLLDKDEIDIADKALVQKKITELQPSIVINAAAYNNVDAAETDTEIAERINGRGVGYLAAAAESVGAVFVHYSTDYVFDGKKKRGYKETDVPSPISAYGVSKLLGETLTQKESTKSYIIRLSRLFGSTGVSQQAKESFVDKMVQASKEHATLTVIDEELSCPTYASDLAGATKDIVEKSLPFGIYHVTNEGACTWYGFATEIFRQIGWSGKLIPVPANTYPRPAKRPSFSKLVNTKLQPLRPWQEALADYLHIRP
ncbi:MAG: dTDP-4-dehydrorhamnose reductase [Patescibacteria group bacterium]|jgi:dTDP-4-dehydrorhamnose reductase